MTEKTSFYIDYESGQWIGQWYQKDEGRTYRKRGSNIAELRRWAKKNEFKVVIVASAVIINEFDN